MKKIVLAYNFTQERVKILRTLCMMLKVQLKPVPTAEVEQPVGVLAGLITAEEATVQNAEQQAQQEKAQAQGTSTNAPDKLTEQVPVPKLEMLFLCGFDQELLNRLLVAIRKSRLQKVELKAMLTPTNISWSGAKLLREISAEHAYMQKNFTMKHEAKPSTEAKQQKD
jgi:hypothetical protein